MNKSLLPLQSNCGRQKHVIGKEDLVKLLRWHFGHSDFRGKQLEAIEAVLSGRDCFCLMPTGGGKSMCYQVPALTKPGIVLVVSPLIALMENQVSTLKEKEIPAEFLSSTRTVQVKNKIYEDLESGKPAVRLLYMTPELIATSGFMSKLTKIHARGLLNLIAIDEVNKLDKNAIPETLREAGKQRLLIAIKQNHRMVSDSRWLSTADPMELMNKLSSSNPALPSKNVTSIVNCAPTSSNLSVPMSANVNDEEVHDNAGSQDPIRSPASLLHGSPSAKLPPILSFSQFINSRKAKNHASASNRESPDRGKRNLEKRMRFQ